MKTRTENSSGRGRKTNPEHGRGTPGRLGRGLFCIEVNPRN